MNGQPFEYITDAIIIVVTGILSWVFNRKDSSVSEAATEALSKAICYEIYSEAEGDLTPLTSEDIIERHTAKSKHYTSSAKLNDMLIQLEPADILWAMNQIKESRGIHTQW